MNDQAIIEVAKRACQDRWGGVNCKAVAVAVAEGIQDGETVKIIRHHWVEREGNDIVTYTDVAYDQIGDDVEVSRATIGTPAGDQAYAETLVAKAARAGRVDIPEIVG